MASAEQLIHDAQYAFHSISAGSADEKKYASRARRIAKRIVRRYPASTEATQAHEILSRLGVQSVLPTPSRTERATQFLKDHAGHVDHFGTGDNEEAMNSDDWKRLLLDFWRLPDSKKKYLFIAVPVLFFFPGTIFVLAGLAILYAFKPDLLKNHLRRLLTALGSAPSDT